MYREYLCKYTYTCKSTHEYVSAYIRMQTCICLTGILVFLGFCIRASGLGVSGGRWRFGALGMSPRLTVDMPEFAQGAVNSKLFAGILRGRTFLEASL